ncbi:MAG: helix-hairpin-helix domain-containing protein, partial [Anaerolineales bacterium]|nr:helix-hairpin-helix domain-containing protein [Anaerolineales bacterium]
GFTAQAEPDVVNLALSLQEGMHIYVPSTAEAEEINMLVVSAEPLPSSTDTPSSSAEAAGGLININRASQAELETLPGIGPSTAQKIIAFREDNGLFTTIEGIMEVAGIGPAKFEGVKDFITVEE